MKEGRGNEMSADVGALGNNKYTNMAAAAAAAATAAAANILD